MEADLMAETPAPATEEASRSLLEPPGGLLMWIVVTLELLTFSMVFVVVAQFRIGDAELFAAGQRHLDVRLGLAQTIALLTSGWLVAEAVIATRRDAITRARRYYAAGIVAGLGFVVLKVIDYVAKGQAGLGLNDDFGAAYVLATGFHFAHVLVGLTALVYVATRLGRKPFEDRETAVAGTALFWHMCDIAWFFLFPLFYAR